MLKSYKDLIVWKKAYNFCLQIYKLTRKFPNEEKFCLVLQMRRASISIPSNIAEGYARKTPREYIYSLYVSYGSLCELETQIIIAKDLGYFDDRKFQLLEEGLSEIGKMLKAIIKSLKNKNTKH